MKIRKTNQSAGIVGNVVDNLNSTSTLDALSANQGKVLNEKLNNYNLKTYSNPSQFGLDSYSTIAEICTAMPGSSILLMTGSGEFSFTDFTAMSFGTVFIIKQGNYRCVIEIIGSETTSQSERWTAIWRVDSGLSSWHRMITDDSTFYGKYTMTDSGILIKCNSNLTQGDKYTLIITGASNASTIPIHSILRVYHSSTTFKQEGIINNGFELSGITYERVDSHIGYIHIPLAQYSTMTVQSPPWVYIEVSNASLDSI